MGVVLTVKMDGFAQALSHIRKVSDYVDSAVPEITNEMFRAAGTIFEKNFMAEGSGFGVGGWAALEESTVRKREAAGFSGEHPILARYQDLRTITASSLRVADGSGQFTATDPDGKTIRVSLNIGSNGGYAAASGDKAWNQVQTSNHKARPFWFTTKTVTNSMRKRVIMHLADEIKRL